MQRSACAALFTEDVPDARFVRRRESTFFRIASVRGIGWCGRRPRMRERLRRVLEIISADRETEARWLNTVSLLEFVGARKISRTVADRHPSLEVLEHWADETRHALAFKRLAYEVGGPHASEYLCPREAGTYFEGLDHALCAWAADVVGRRDERLSYLLTTTMVERRAMQLYPLYRASSRQPAVREELRRVIGEEQAHRVGIEKQCLESLNGRDLAEPARIEEKLFDVFLTALEAKVAA